MGVGYTPFKGEGGAIRVGTGLRSAIGAVRPYGEVSDRRELNSYISALVQLQEEE